MRLRIIIAVAVLAASCSRERIVKLGWDPPAVPVDRYDVFIDDHKVREILPPPLDAACHCLLVWVPVPQGTHVVKVVAYNAEGRASIPATLTVQ